MAKASKLKGSNVLRLEVVPIEEVPLRTAYNWGALCDAIGNLSQDEALKIPDGGTNTSFRSNLLVQAKRRGLNVITRVRSGVIYVALARETEISR